MDHKQCHKYKTRLAVTERHRVLYYYTINVLLFSCQFRCFSIYEQHYLSGCCSDTHPILNPCEQHYRLHIEGTNIESHILFPLRLSLRLSCYNIEFSAESLFVGLEIPHWTHRTSPDLGLGEVSCKVFRWTR